MIDRRVPRFCLSCERFCSSFPLRNFIAVACKKQKWVRGLSDQTREAEHSLDKFQPSIYNLHSTGEMLSYIFNEQNKGYDVSQVSG
jgi:hypothetical protein